MTVAHGYRADECESLVKPFMYRNDVHIVAKPRRGAERHIEAVSLGVHIEGVCRPHPDTQDPLTQALGVAYRMGRIIPLPEDIQFDKKFGDFVEEWLEANLRPLRPDTDVSFETWVKEINHPDHRKQQLRDEHERLVDRLEEGKGEFGQSRLVHFGVNMFAKDEFYDDTKHARMIWARSDMAKITFGPYIHAIEKEIYDNPAFIKHVEVRERGKYIMNRLYQDGSVYIATDYSSWEAHFRRMLMKACEMKLYSWALQYVQGGKEVVDLIERVTTQRNYCSGRFVSVSLEACRMSGEMQTSLGNGFTNYMLMAYLCKSMGVEPVGVVEGDDGLFRFPSNNYPSSEMFTKLGCDVKLEVHKELNTASFCGLIFDNVDQQVIANPLKIVASMGWGNAKYAYARSTKKKALLRCKALSAVYQYPACPIVTALGLYILRCTRSIDIRRIVQFQSWWEFEILSKALKVPLSEISRDIGIGTRILFSEQYGISIELQHLIEARFNEKTHLEPLEVPELLSLFPETWKRFADYYVVDKISDGSSKSYLPWARVVEADSYFDFCGADNSPQW